MQEIAAMKLAIGEQVPTSVPRADATRTGAAIASSHEHVMQA
jgi:hypothetical protein